MGQPQPSHDVPALAAASLSKRYGSRAWALSEVTLEVGWGRVTALVGPNAAGKSTLIKTWVGFEQPTRGHVFVGGRDPWRDRASVSSLTAYMPQAPALYRELTAEEHVELCRHYRPTFDRQDAMRRLRALSLPAAERVSALSGGQAAQLGLVIALATHAPILLLDEPLASLDPLARREFLDVLTNGVRETGASVLMSSHVVSDIENAADWLVVLGAGQVLLDMSVGDAIATHRVMARGAFRDGNAIVAHLPGQLGDLVRDGVRPLDGRPASLEDVVLGYLAKGRTLDEAVTPPGRWAA